MAENIGIFALCQDFASGAKSHARKLLTSLLQQIILRLAMALNMALKVAILNSGRHQVEVAKDAGMHPTVLSMIVRGHREPTPNQARALAKALRTKADQLFAEVA